MATRWFFLIVLENFDFSMDLLILDICMPKMSGPECLVKVRNKLGPEFPVMAITALALDDEISELKVQAFQEIITKPIDIYDVLDKVMKLCPIK